MIRRVNALILTILIMLAWPLTAATAADTETTITLNAPEGKTLDGLQVHYLKIGEYTNPTGCTETTCSSVSVSDYSENSALFCTSIMLKEQNIDIGNKPEQAENLLKILMDDTQSQAIDKALNSKAFNSCIDSEAMPTSLALSGTTMTITPENRGTKTGPGIYLLIYSFSTSNGLISSPSQATVIGTKINDRYDLRDNGTVQTLGVTTVKFTRPDLIIEKKDAETGEPIPGVEFVVAEDWGKGGVQYRVWNSTTNTWEPINEYLGNPNINNATVFTTDRNGRATIPYIPYTSTYIVIMEKTVPAGYDSEYRISFMYMPISESNKTGSIRFQYYSTDKRNPLVSSGGQTIEHGEIPVVDNTVTVLNKPLKSVSTMPNTGGQPFLALLTGLVLIGGGMLTLRQPSRREHTR